MDKLKATNILLFILVVFVIGLVLKLTQEVMIALLLSVLLAYIMDPLVALLKKVGLPLWLGVAITSVIFIGIFSGLGFIIYFSTMEFAHKFPGYQEKLVQTLEDLVSQLEVSTNGNIRVDVLENLKSIPIASMAFKGARFLVSSVLQFIMIFFFAILILYGKYNFPKKLLKAFPGREKRRIPIIMKHIDIEVRKYIAMKTLICLMTGVGTTVILWSFRVEFGIALGFMAFVLTYIPTVGPLVAILIPSLIGLAQYGIVVTPLWIVSVLASMHIFIGSLIEPKLMGDTMNLTFLVIFFSLFFWGWMWGAAGVLLAVPMTTSIKIIMENIPMTFPLAKLLERRKPKKRFLFRDR